MNWTKIRSDNGLAFKKYAKFKNTALADISIFEGKLLYDWDGVTHPFNDRDLYDFFEKEHEIYINIEPVFSGKMTARYMRFSGFQIEVTYIDTSGRLIQIYDDELDELITDRTKVESIAFEYCFQVLERRLNKNK